MTFFCEVIKIKESIKLKEIIKIKNKLNYTYTIKNELNKKIKNSSIYTNIKEVDNKGILHLKTGEVASVIEIKAIDLSLSSNIEKKSFYHLLKQIYQIKNINMKCYKLDDKINLNLNKINIRNKQKNQSERKSKLLQDNLELIENLEEKHFRSEERRVGKEC